MINILLSKDSDREYLRKTNQDTEEVEQNNQFTFHQTQKKKSEVFRNPFAVKRNIKNMFIKVSRNREEITCFERTISNIITL